MFANSHFALATHVVTVLAMRGDGPPVTSAQLAQSVNTNPAFLRTLLGQLRRAGIIDVALGKGGGATLARPASKVTLADVYRAVEKRPPAQLHRCAPNRKCVVGRSILPILCGVVEDVEAAALERLAATTVADLVARIQRRA
jgi:Rrf2 family protein